MIILFLFFLYDFSFKTHAETRFIFPTDLDGDEKKELIFLHPEKRISIFSISQNGFDSFLKGVQILKDGVIIDFGDFYPDLKGDEIFVAKSDGIYVFKFESGNINLIKFFKFQESSLYPESKILKKGKILYNDKLIFFYPDKGILIDRKGNFDTIPILVEKDISTDEDKSIYEIPKKSPLKTTYISPVLFFSDVNGDGIPDLTQYSNDSLFVFFKKGNKFSNSKDIAIDLSFLKVKEEKFPLPPSIFLNDINGDGKADILLTKFGEIVFGTKSIIYLFLNQNGYFKNTPDQVIVSESSLPDVKLIDLNNDGRLDLITNITPFNLWTIIKLLITRKSEINYGFYLFKENDFEKTPSFTKKFSISLDIEKEEEEGEIEIIDFDRDNFYDIIYFKKEEIFVYKGEKKGFSEKPFISFKIKTSRNYIFEDFNQDNKTDILFFKSKNKETIVWGFFQ